MPATILFKLLAPKGSLWIGNGVQNLTAGIALLPIAFTFADISDIVRARGFWEPSHSWCWAARSWPICCGFIF